MDILMSAGERRVPLLDKIILAAGLLLCAVYLPFAFLYRPVAKRKRLWLPGWDIFYTDIKQAKKTEQIIYGKLLECEELGLKGKPDYIYKKGGLLTPVELKSASLGKLPAPHEGDMMQLAAYFAIIEDTFDIKPRFGYLVYSDCAFKIKNTGRLRKRLVNILSDMRGMLDTGEGSANPSFQTCRHCMCRGTVCDKELM